MNTPRRRASGLLKDSSLVESSEKVPVEDGKPCGNAQDASPLEDTNHDGSLSSRSYVTRLLWTVAGILFMLLSVSFLSRHGQRIFGIDIDRPDRLPNHEDGLGIALHPQDHVFREPTTISLEWFISTGLRAPDGVMKRVYLINDDFPGPTIEARSGDTIKIYVKNDIKDNEGLSIHWHGLDMRGFNDMDGAVGLTQCPIAQGKEFVYEFKIDDSQHGTYWYHAHSQVQRADGLYGGLVIHKPADLRQVSEQSHYGYGSEVLLLVGDWYHRSAEEILLYYMSSRSFGNEPVPDSLLINGAGSFNCSMAAKARPLQCVRKARPRLRVTTGYSTRLRIVNTGSLPGFTIGIDNAKLLPVQVDGGNEMVGETSDHVGIIYPGERADVIATWDTNITHPSMLHIAFDEEDFNYPNPSLVSEQAFPIDVSSIQHPHAIRPRTEDLSAKSKYFDLQNAHSLNPLPNPQATPSNMVLYTTTMKLAKNKNIPQGFMNHTSWSPQSSPALPLTLLSRSSWDSNQFIPFIASSETSDPAWLDIVLNNLDDGGHPFHLHGHKFYVLSTHKGERGWGSYNPFALTPKDSPAGPYDLDRPLLKDTVFVPRRGYMVLRVKMDNPGIWMFHCHILWHQASGMAMGFQVGGDEEMGFASSASNTARELCGMFES